jgi:Putative  PD-(D/E)XK family member, (DUF4420)
MTQDVERLVKEIEALPKSTGSMRDAVTVVDQRLHLAKTSTGYLELFIEGTRESFGHAAVGHSLEFGRFQDSRSSREFPALLVRSRNTDVRPMAHFAYEACRSLEGTPDVSNERLLELLAPYLGLVLQRQLLSMEQQLGLLGELMFLTEVLNRAGEVNVDPGLAVQSWTGWDSASRDFAAKDVAVEAKVTRRRGRAHWIHPMHQLLSANGESERVYVYSVGVSIDRSRSFRLLTMIDRVLMQISGRHKEIFLGRLSQYGGVGFEESSRGQYELEAGFLVTQAPALIRVDNQEDILRPESFVGNALPVRVSDLRYIADLDGLPTVSISERNLVLDSLLGLGSQNRERGSPVSH